MRTVLDYVAPSATLDLASTGYAGAAPVGSVPEPPRPADRPLTEAQARMLEDAECELEGRQARNQGKTLVEVSPEYAEHVAYTATLDHNPNSAANRAAVKRGVRAVKEWKRLERLNARGPRRPNADLRMRAQLLRFVHQMSQAPAPRSETCSRPAGRGGGHSRIKSRGSPKSDDAPQLPRPLTGRERRHLKQLVSVARLEQISTRKQCHECFRDLTLDEFRPARRTCKGCETDARLARRAASAVAS